MNLPTDDWVRVVDISRNQGPIDFVKMYATGVRRLIIRVSNGQTIDDHFAGYYQAALAAGFKPADICFYSFINPKRGSGAQCAKATLDAIRAVVGHTNVGYMLDIEQYANESPNIGSSPVWGQAFTAWLREHIATVNAQAPGAVIFGYSNFAYWNSAAGPQDDQLASELDWLAARYPAYSDAAYAKVGYPGDPDSWPDWAFHAQPAGPIPPRGGVWVGWQVSAGWNRQGATYGVTSRDLDLNIVQPDAWARWTGQSNTTPDPVPLPVLEANMAALVTDNTYPVPGFKVYVLRDDDGYKREISPEEYRGRGSPAPVVLDDLDLKAIPTYVSPAAPGVPVVDYDKLAAAIAPLVPTKFHSTSTTTTETTAAG